MPKLKSKCKKKLTFSKIYYTFVLMKFKTYSKLRKAVIAIVLLGVFVSVYFGYIFISAFSVGIGMVIVSFLKTQVTDAVDDERLNDIHEKAAMTSFRIMLPILGLTSLTLIYSAGGPFYFLYVLGVVLGYITCLGVAIYLISYWYLNRKYG